MKPLIFSVMMAAFFVTASATSELTMTEGEKVVCEFYGKYAGVCSIPAVGGVLEEDGHRVVYCNCIGTGSNAASDVIANEIAKIFRKYKNNQKPAFYVWLTSSD
jgi:hypothetical protein